MIPLGTGVLTWMRMERVTDRYGYVWLMERGGGDEPEFAADPTPVRLQIIPPARGSLVAVVREARESPHIGDIARGVGPTTPKVGERIELGTGTLSFKQDVEPGTWEVGLIPEDGRTYDWLDINACYRAIHQTVDLYFEPKEA